MTTTAQNLKQRPVALRLLLAGGVIGPLLFILVFSIEGAMRPDYNPWRHYVSALSLGERGWVQIANFIICGALIFGFAIGLKRVLPSGKGSTWGPILLGTIGIGLIGSGIFVMDPDLGYPPGAPTTQTLHGNIHLLLGAVVFSALPAVCFVLARRFAADLTWRGWTIYSLVNGVLLIMFIIAQKVAALSTDPKAPIGLLQRLTIIAGFVWISLLAFQLMREEPPRSR
jgi:hypothetical membrane protein